MTQPTRQDTWKDKIVPWYLVLFFVVIFIVNGFFVYFATSSFTGVETKDAYEKGLAYNQTLEQKNDQAQWGWQDHFSFTSPSSGQGRIKFFLTKGKRYVDIQKIEGVLFRPTHEGQDIQLNFVEEGYDEFVSTFDLPLKGLWEARITAYQGKKSKRQYKQHYRFHVE